MTVLNSGISWCTGTLNLSIGCTQIPVPGGSACDFCYAKTLVERGILRGNGADFSKVNLYPKRLADLKRFAPARGSDGLLEPKLVFVNSLSDFWHESIPDSFIHAAFDGFERHPDVTVQILTKRPVRMRKVMADRYKAGVPANYWLGVSAESNAVKARLNILRRLKDQVGEFCAFVSIEPIFAACDELSLEGIDWALTGGESGPNARDMKPEWLEQANENALSNAVALHFKQWGKPGNNPAVRQIMAESKITQTRAWALAVERGLELAPHEKGGATYKGRVIQEKPPAFHAFKARLNRP